MRVRAQRLIGVRGFLGRNWVVSAAVVVRRAAGAAAGADQPE